MFNERALQGLFSSLNQHVPGARISLAEMLDQEKPSYTGRDGSVFKVERQELMLIAGLLDEEERRKLKIPILLMTDISYGDGYWKVIGKLEVRVISRLIGREPEKDDEIRIFYPYLNDIRRKLPTATSTLFSY